MTIFALLGSTALWLLYAWLLSAILASYLSGRKGYGERAGLASGLLLNFIGVIIWLDRAAQAGVAVEEGRPDRPRRPEAHAARRPATAAPTADAGSSAPVDE